MPAVAANTSVGSRLIAELIRDGGTHEIAVGTSGTQATIGDAGLVTETDRVSALASIPSGNPRVVKAYAEFSFAQTQTIRELGWFLEGILLQRLSLDGIQVNLNTTLKVTLARRQDPQTAG